MNKNSYLVVGTYTKGSSEGIYVYRLNPDKGELMPVSVYKVENPSFIAFNKNATLLYAVTESDNSFANAFSFDRGTGTISLINRMATSGAGSCHIAIDNNEKFVVTASYGGGSISIFPISSNGGLGEELQHISFTGKSEHSERQEAPHPHCSVFSADGRYLFVTDLGTDTIYRFEIDYSGRQDFIVESSRKDFKVKSGSGPRHLIFSKNGGYLYLVNELSGTAIAYKYNNGDIEQLQELCIGMERQEGGGGMALSADEKYLYVSMREGNDGISTFKIQNDGTLSHFAYNNVSEHPRDITLSSDGRYLLAAAMKENKIDIMKILDDGKLANTEIYIHLDKPAYVGFI